MTTPQAFPEEIDALKAALVTERTARQQAEARASGAEALVAHLKLLIAKMRRDRFGPSSEHARRLLDQLELQLEELKRAPPRTKPLPTPMPHQYAALAASGPSERHCRHICRASGW